MSDLRAVVDRVENDMAVLLVGEESYRIILPRNLLPADAAEGVILNIAIDVDLAATEQAKKRVQDLIDRLSEGND